MVTLKMFSKYRRRKKEEGGEGEERGREGKFNIMTWLKWRGIPIGIHSQQFSFFQTIEANK